MVMIMKEQTACFTGHRNIQKNSILILKEKVKQVLIHLIENDISYFLNGGARGFDLVSAQCVLDLKKEYPHIQLIMVLPCKAQTKSWHMKEKWE